MGDVWNAESLAITIKTMLFWRIVVVFFIFFFLEVARKAARKASIFKSQQWDQLNRASMVSYPNCSVAPTVPYITTAV